MARTRAIKPGFFKNEELASCCPLARLLFAGLWCLADREGCLEDRPLRIKADVLPYDDCDVNQMLGDLMRKGFIHRYATPKGRFILILNFTKHQRPHPKEPRVWADRPQKGPADQHRQDSLTGSRDLSRPVHDEPEKGGDEQVSGRELSVTSCAYSPLILLSSSAAPPLASAGAEACPEPAEPASGPEPAPAEAVLTFPTVPGAKGGAKEWPLTSAKLAEYRESFPGVDVLAECRKALQWARDNPGRRKTAKGMPCFLTNWLARAQNTGRCVRAPAAAGPPAESDAEAAARLRREREREAAERAAARGQGLFPEGENG